MVRTVKAKEKEKKKSGRTHDFKLFKKSGIKFGALMKVIADKGYQGIAIAGFYNYDLAN